MLKFNPDSRIKKFMEEMMKAKVTEGGLVIPKELLEGVDEVDIRKEEKRIMIVPTIMKDSILELGSDPIICGSSDVSEHHDQYLYGSN